MIKKNGQTFRSSLNLGQKQPIFLVQCKDVQGILWASNVVIKKKKKTFVCFVTVLDTSYNYNSNALCLIDHNIIVDNC